MICLRNSEIKIIPSKSFCPRLRASSALRAANATGISPGGGPIDATRQEQCRITKKQPYDITRMFGAVQIEVNEHFAYDDRGWNISDGTNATSQHEAP